MKTIFKYTLDFKSRQTVLMPTGAEILSVANQREKICIWAEVHDIPDTDERHFAIYGTGHDVIEEEKQFVGTVILHGGSLVFHIYETRKR